MRKLRHALCFRLTDEEMQMYQQLLTHLPLVCFQKTRSSRFRALLKSLSKLESYREKRSTPLRAWEADDEDHDSEEMRARCFCFSISQAGTQTGKRGGGW